jgi:hypothetical protein
VEIRRAEQGGKSLQIIEGVNKMKVETRLNKILMIEDKDRRKHKLFEFIMKVMPQSIIQKKAIEEYNKT